MKYIPLFDDCLINRRRNIVREFHTPEWLDEFQFENHDVAIGPTWSSVVPAPEGGWFLYYGVDIKGDNRDTALCLARSSDGLSWERTSGNPPGHPDVPDVIFYEDAPTSNAVMFDPADPDPDRRYKMTTKTRGKTDRACYMVYSPDGIHWHMDRRHPFLPRPSDTMLCPARNPVTDRLQISIRYAHIDRRIHILENLDNDRWSEPRLVLTPDPLDAPMCMFYGMPQFPCCDMLIGMLWLYRTGAGETAGNKLRGTIETELAYSYDGQCWNRTRHKLMPLRQRGMPGAGMIFGSAMIETDDHMLIYARGNRFEHGYVKETGRQPEFHQGTLLCGRMRKEGLVSLGSGPATGSFTTDCLYFRSASLAMNAVAPFGGIRVQVCDTECNPLPGYTFDECEVFTGDSARARPGWKKHADLSGAIRILKDNTRFPGWGRLEFELNQASVYSIRGDFGVNRYARPDGGMDYLR